jgi:hypothetical protein
VNPIKLLKIYRKADRVVNLLGDAKVNKSLWKSKTFWFNLLTGAASLAGVIPLDPSISGAIVGVINVGLRLVTTEPVSVK